MWESWKYLYWSRKKTQIGIVTNGTLIDERFAELVQRYHILVTISYDGDIKVNDKLRKDVHGNGMSNLILKMPRC